MTGRKIPIKAIILSIIASWQMVSGTWIYAKAAIAQQLLEIAWQKTKADSGPRKPWPWADTWPIARISVAQFDINQVILAGDSARTLAFGPAVSTSWRSPEIDSVTLISGHRDTHFAFLKNLRVGHSIVIETIHARFTFVVTGLMVIDTHNISAIDKSSKNTLILATCYPFDAVIPGGTLRYLVVAEARPRLE